MALEDTGATPEVIEPAEEIVEPKSMDDTIRETLASMKERGIEPEAAAPEDAEQKAQRIRDEKGKFAAGKEPAAPIEPAPEPVAEPIKAAPNTWKKEAHEAWIKADPVIRAEVERREADFHRGIEQYKQAAQFANNIQQAIQPYAATIQSLGIAPEKAISELMAADHRLRYGQPHEKQAYFAQLARAYGVDLGQVSAEQPQIDPNVAALQQQVQQLEGFIRNQSLMGEQQQQQALNSEIAAFAADPNHSHFEAVRPHMHALLQAGQATSLADAYEQAVFANPQTRALMLAQQRDAERAEATKKAEAARQAASVNVRARPAMPTAQPIGSMDDTIRATLRRLQNA